MKSIVSLASGIALLMLVIVISTIGLSNSVLASSSSHTDALDAAVVISQDSRPVKATPPPPPPPTRKNPTTKPQVPTNDNDNAPLTYVLMQTSMGDIVIELNRGKAPITVANFLSYTDKKYYDGTIYHRVIRGFMIQGGGFTEDLKKKPTGKPIKNEWTNGLSNADGTIAMARLGRQPDSATAQFFINVKDNTMLDQPRDGAGYAVFGKVVAGMKTVRNIEGTFTTTKGAYRDVPAETVKINKVTRISDEDAMNRMAQERKPTTRKSGTQ